MYSDTAKRILLIIGVICIYANSLWAASKQAEVKKGNAHYFKREFDQSIEKYKAALKKDPESDIINFNLGTALYKMGEYKEAQQHLAKALLSDDKVLKQKAFYNSGNSFYKSGITEEDQQIDQAIADVTQSVQHLESAVGLNADDQEAKNNYTFVQKELERLKQKQEEQKDSKFCPNPKKEDGNKDQKSEENKSQQTKPEDQKSEEQKSQEQKSEDQNQPKENQSSAEKENNQPEEKPEDSKSAEENNKDKKDSEDSSAQKAESTQPEGEGINAEQSLEAKDTGELTDKESQMLLENYEQNEAPKGMFQMKLQRREQRPVGKDW